MLPHRGPTLALLVSLAARLRLATEAFNARSRPGDTAIGPGDVQLDDLAPEEHARLEQLGQQDLWQLINEPEPTTLEANDAKPITAPDSRNTRPAA